VLGRSLGELWEGRSFQSPSISGVKQVMEAGLYDLATLQDMAELHVIAVIRLGRLLAAAQKSVGGRPEKTPAQHAAVSEYRRLLEPGREKSEK
jgi:hypothetical protein